MKMLLVAYMTQRQVIVWSVNIIWERTRTKVSVSEFNVQFWRVIGGTEEMLEKQRLG
jgi:hypothetical protein